MKNRLAVPFPFTGFAEMVWDIGTKVVAAIPLRVEIGHTDGDGREISPPKSW